MRHRSFAVPLAGAVLVLASALPADEVRAQPAASASPEPVDYADPAHWLCRPGRDDACAVDLTTTVVSADGTTTTEEWSPHPDPPVDCFYVYPTVSTDGTPNSDLRPDPPERSVIRAQFARFGAVCRRFAPLYRQVTLTALRARFSGDPMEADREVAYQDVRGAWNDYLARDNGGRGVVLIGHSQGTSMLRRLIQEEIDGEPVRSRIVSALLLGMNISVPEGEDVGGDFRTLPLCRSGAQTGCVVTYVSFLADEPPPSGTLFGRVEEPGHVAACTNPAELDGSGGRLRSYFTTGDAPGRWLEEKTISTPFVRLPGLVTSECVSNELGSYLAVTVHADASDPRADDIGGRVVSGGEPQPRWGLHLVDVHLAMGNLVELVRRQARSFGSASR